MTSEPIIPAIRAQASDGYGGGGGGALWFRVSSNRENRNPETREFKKRGRRTQILED